jgi:pimeloyl-ACP methyl ester carboxylesterase
VDDREIGGSTGNFSEATSEDFASDVLAGIKYLKSRKEINPEHIGLIGHSEGGLIAPMAAANSPDDVAFIVMMAGPGLNGEELLHLQGTSILKAAGASEKLITYCRAHRERMFNILRTEKNNAIAEKKLLELGEKAEAELNEEEKELLKSFESGELGMQLMLSPWYRWYLTYDPKSSLTKVKCPVLAIIGELDLQVAPKENLRAIEEVLKAGGNKSYTIKELANLNHLFQTAQTGELSEYGKIEETISPIALKLIADWILEQTEKGGGQSPLKGEKT